MGLRFVSGRHIGPADSRRRKRAAAQAEARDQVGFTVGMLSILMPVSAILAGAVGVVAQLVTPVEATVSAGFVVLVFVLLAGFLSFGSLGELLGTVLVRGPAAVAAWLAPVPVLGGVALFLGCTIVIWFPIVVLAIVAWML